MGSDTGCGGIKPASSIVIQNRLTSHLRGARCMGHVEIRVLRFDRMRHTRNSARERNPICAWTSKNAQRQSAGD